MLEANIEFVLKKDMQDACVGVEAEKEKYVVHPGIDYTRNRKMTMADVIFSAAIEEGNSLPKELFDIQSNAGIPLERRITVSGYVQQRDKIKPAGFKKAFDNFNESTVKYDTKTIKSRHLLAIDGTTVNLAKQPGTKTWMENGENEGFNQFHVNACFDVLNKTYTDVVVQPQPKTHEVDAARQIARRLDPDTRYLITTDRGYGSFDLMATVADDCKQEYLFRINNSFREVMDLPDEPCDKTISVLILKEQTNENKRIFRHFEEQHDKGDRTHYVHRLYGPSKFGKYKKDISWFHDDHYLMNIRIVKLQLSNGNWEVLFTNLSKEEFPAEELKELYHARWGIETSFRELKYAIGLINFHAKKEDSVEQEIYARLMGYNFCSRVANSVVVEQKADNAYEYKINFVQAIHICIDFLKRSRTDSITDAIKSYLTPIRPGRSDERNIKPKSASFFIYRVA